MTNLEQSFNLLFQPPPASDRLLSMSNLFINYLRNSELNPIFFKAALT